MKFKHFIGLDMAKESFVIAVHGHTFSKQYSNDLKSIKKLFKSLPKVLGCSLDQCLFCVEHTGLYSLEIVQFLNQLGLSYTMIPGLELKKSLGITRGKDDVVDAARIAEYGFLRKDKIKLHQLPSQQITNLKHLMCLRAMHVRHRAAYLCRYKEQKRVLKHSKVGLLKSQYQIIKTFDKEILKVETQIKNIIDDNAEMKRYYDLLTSIKGVGFVLATQLIVTTNCFVSFDDCRKYACYVGTAPFPYESGKMKSARRINKISDGDTRALLTLAARSAMKHDPEIRLFAKRKIDQGKSKKNVTNAVRNKLLARIFSVAKRGTPYVIMNKYAA